MDDDGQNILGMVSRGSPVTKAGSMGHHCPVCHPTRVWDCSSSHHSICTTQVLQNYLQRCSSAGQRATQQSLNIFLCYSNKPIQAEGWICPFMHRENGFLLLSTINTCPPHAPNNLVVPSASICHTSLLFPKGLLLPSLSSTGKTLH